MRIPYCLPAFPLLSLLFMHTFVFLVLVIPRFGQTVCSFCITTDTNANRDTYNARGPKERERKRGRRNKRIHLSSTNLVYPVTRRAKATCILHDQVTPSLTPPNTPHSPRDLKYTHTKTTHKQSNLTHPNPQTTLNTPISKSNKAT